MPLQQTSGNVTADAYGGGVAAVPNYIEDVFSTYLYNAGSPKTIVNGIDLAGKGGMVWTKWRSGVYGAISNGFWDTARGAKKELVCPSTAGQYTYSTDGVTSFNSDGFTAVATTDTYDATAPDANALFASWTFRKQPKFFDVVTFTGNGTTNNVAHSLGSAPGCIIVKRTDSAQNWAVYHRGDGTSQKTTVSLNTTNAVGYNGTIPGMTATTFDANWIYDYTGTTANQSGGTYVAYLFAHNAGGFGLTGTDNVISCGSFTTNGSGQATVTLGYEPQWLLFKQADGVDNWREFDTMRGWSMTQDNFLFPNTAGAETASSGWGNPTATGFTIDSANASKTYIYIAIRRGPMKVPTDATKVFAPIARTGTGTNPTVVTSGTNPDLLMSFPRTASPAAYGMCYWDKLRGVTQMLQSANTNAETATSSTYTLQGWQNTGNQAGADFIDGYLNYSGSAYENYLLTRAPGFFDEVCYTGDGTNGKAYNHNLTVVPELVIVKSRSGTSNWKVLYQPDMRVMSSNTTGAYESAANTKYYFGNDTIDISPTATQFTVSNGGSLNASGSTYVAFLFASCPGVSKVGSYTGTGATQTISCGFTGGARFVLIKRTDSTGDWYVWDTARGMVAGTDPSLLLNSTAAEVNANSIYTTTGGFQIVSTASGINASGGTYLFMAIS